MTERDWLTADDGYALYRSMTRGLLDQQIKVSDRQWRLIACGCCRSGWASLDELARETIRVAERYADNAFPSTTDGRQAMTVASRIWISATVNSVAPRFSEMAPHHPTACTAAFTAVRSDLVPNAAAIIREVVGNPFRPVLLVRNDWQSYLHHDLHVLFHEKWLTPDVRRLAEACNDGEWEAAGPLCDALEEAGVSGEPCTICDGSGTCWVCHCFMYDCGEFGDDWKDHCKSKTCDVCPRCAGTGRIPHPVVAHLQCECLRLKGCWVVDLLAGKV